MANHYVTALPMCQGKSVLLNTKSAFNFCHNYIHFYAFIGVGVLTGMRVLA